MTDIAITETWRDWLPKNDSGPATEELLTREQLLGRLREIGIDVSEPNLRRWEYLGVIPGAIRRRHTGATRAVYPPWMLQVIVLVRKMQGDGATLADIKTRLATEARPAIEKGDRHIELFADEVASEVNQQTIRKGVLAFVRQREFLANSFVTRLTITYTHEKPDEEPHITYTAKSL